MVSVTVIPIAVADVRIHDAKQIAISRCVDQPGKEHISEQSADSSMIEVVGAVPGDLIVKVCLTPWLSCDTKHITLSVNDIQRSELNAERLKYHVPGNKYALVLSMLAFHSS